MNIKQIINELNQNNSQNYKLEVLKKYKDNQLFQKVLKMTYDTVKYTYGISTKSLNSDKFKMYCELHKNNYNENNVITLSEAFEFLEIYFCTRIYTGNTALEEISKLLLSLQEDDKFIVQRILDRDLKINLGKKQINKIFKNLITEVPYMRCALFETGPKGTAKNIKFPAYIQLKSDGMYAAVTVHSNDAYIVSRSGETLHLPHLVEYFKKLPEGVYTGELLVKNMNDRFSANGFINSDEDDKTDVYIQLWDYILLDEYNRPKDKKNKTPYSIRFSELNRIISSNPSEYVYIIESYEIQNLKEALSHVAKWMKNGLEGGILKDKSNIFVSSTSKTQLKLKLDIEIEVRCTGFIEGTKGTKRENTFGSIVFSTDDEKIIGSASGFTDDMLEEINNARDKYL